MMKRDIIEVIDIYIMVMMLTVLSAGCSTKPLAPEPSTVFQYYLEQLFVVNLIKPVPLNLRGGRR